MLRPNHHGIKRFGLVENVYNLEFILEGIGLSSFTGLGGDVQVDKEKAGKESSEEDSQVSSELNLKGQRFSGHRLNNGVNSEGRGRHEGNRGGSGGSLGDSCELERNERKEDKLVMIFKPRGIHSSILAITKAWTGSSHHRMAEKFCALGWAISVKHQAYFSASA